MGKGVYIKINCKGLNNLLKIRVGETTMTLKMLRQL